MKIVHLTASTFFGGPERQMLGLAEHLLPDVETIFASFHEHGRSAEFLNKVRTAGFPAILIAHDTPNLLAAIHDVQRTIHGADVLFVHGYKAGLLGRIAARREGIPVIGVSRGWTAENWKVKLYERLDRWNLQKLDHVVCVSNGQANKVRRYVKSRQHISVIHNAARLDDFHPKTGRNEGPITVLGAGRLSIEKGFQQIPAILEQLGKWCDVRIQLAGDGPLRAAIEADAQHRGVQHRLDFLGFRHDIDRLMSNADILLLPSFTEGLPNVILEAAAAGIPAVATAVGGTPEAIIQGKTGILVESGDINAMAESLRLLATHHDTRMQMGLAAREYVESHFSFAAQANQYRELIERFAIAVPEVELHPC